jgi:heat shock protein HslJ
MRSIDVGVAGAAALAMTLLGCAGARTGDWVEVSPGSTGSTLSIVGTVHRLDIEGGVWVIRDSQGVAYQPTNLPAAFQREGLAVEGVARRRNDLVSIGMAGTLVELLRIRERPAERAVLRGTSWLLEDLAGAGVVDRVQATLAFADDGSVSGNASCNQFRGTLRVDGDAISFGPLVTTRKACNEAVMQQEQRYLDALRETTRFEIKGSFLYLYSEGRMQPLRFIARASG